MFRLIPSPLITILLCSTGAALAQESTSAPIAARVMALLEDRKLEAISARLPDETDRYTAAIRVGDTGLFLVEAHYLVPSLLNERLWRGEHRDVYVTLNSGSTRKGRRFIQDLGAPGLHPSREDDAPFDLIYDSGTLWLKLDGDWESQKLSRSEYLQRFSEADERYASDLRLLKDALERPDPSR